MPTAWQTFPVEFKGGLVTNLAPLQQGLTAPGTARALINFEPSIEGGYRRILGYTKFDPTFIPPYGEPVVQGSGQSGTTLVIANIFVTPVAGDTFTIAGVTGTYTVVGASFNTTNKVATVTLDTALASSPADRATITFGNNNNLVQGIIYFEQKSVVQRGGAIWESDGTGWIRINKPTYGTVLVSGAGQTGTSLVIDGISGIPQQGDTFIIAGVEKVYTITADVVVTSGAATLTISPALASSPADNAAITFLSSDRASVNKVRFARYGFTGTSCVIGVDGTNKPFKYSLAGYQTLVNSPDDVIGADHVAEFKNQIFFAKDNNLVFTAPYDDLDFDVALGAGSIGLPHKVTGLIVFREQLIIFAKNTIYRLTGNTVSDFQLQPISQDIGCVHEDTIQEVGGDIAFLGPDGVRLLSATDRIGDFGLAVASRPIQSEVNALVAGHTSFSSCTIRGKNQYRLFGFSSSRQPDSAVGVLSTQFADQTAEGMAWAETRGIFVYVSDSIYSGKDAAEVVLFANKDGYAYRMESGDKFDTVDITAYFSTPHFPVTDPRLRKTFYKLTTYIDPKGGLSGKILPRLNFDEPGVIQPPAITFGNTSGTASLYGTAIYGTSRYGGKLKKTFTTQLIGSGNTISFQYSFTGNSAAFSLDAILLEYMNNDRQ